MNITNYHTIVVESLSRLGRSTKDLIWLMETFNAKGVNLVSLKESIDTTTSAGKLLFTLMTVLVLSTLLGVAKCVAEENLLECNDDDTE